MIDPSLLAKKKSLLEGDAVDLEKPEAPGADLLSAGIGAGGQLAQGLLKQAASSEQQKRAINFQAEQTLMDKLLQAQKLKDQFNNSAYRGMLNNFAVAFKK